MSYRAWRRLLWGVGASTMLAAATVSAVFFWNTADATETFSGGKADIFVAPERHTLTKAELAAVVSVAQRFVRTAVARDRPERAYELVGADLRGGLTRKEWATGAIPVVPYPVDTARWKVEYSNTDGVGLLVMLYPDKNVRDVRPAVFSMNVVSVGTGAKSRWLVNGWVPKGGSPSTVESAVGPVAAAGEELERVAVRASDVWLLVPVVLISLIFVVPGIFFVRERRVARRMRRYLDSRA